MKRFLLFTAIFEYLVGFVVFLMAIFLTMPPTTRFAMLIGVMFVFYSARDYEMRWRATQQEAHP